MRRERLPRRIMRGRVGSGATPVVVHDTDVQAIQPTMPLNFYIQCADRDFVTVSLETAVSRREAHRNSPFDVEAQSLGVASFEQAISRSCV